MSDLSPSRDPAHDTGNGNSLSAGPVTCLHCGCLCDDLVVTREGDVIVGIESGCELACSWFTSGHPDSFEAPVATIEGRPATMAEAAQRSAELLSKGRAPLIIGLDGSTNESVAEAIALAELTGATLDLAASNSASARNLSFARVGRISATLGEVKDRADVVVFWGADPVRTHPRHWERYSVSAVGRFIPEGRAARTVVVVDDQRTDTAVRADHFLRIDREKEFELLWTLRGLVKGLDLSASRVRSATGIELGPLRQLADIFRKSRYGALFWGSPVVERNVADAAAVLEAANGVVRELNRHTRFVILSMGEPGNATGAGAVLCWQTGFPSALDLAAGYPVSLPGVTTGEDRMRRQEADVVVLVGHMAVERFDHLAAGLSTIAISAPDESTGASSRCLVRCHSATPGLDEAGTVLRTDGVALPLRPVRTARFPTERQWLDAIRGKVLAHRKS